MCSQPLVAAPRFAKRSVGRLEIVTLRYPGLGHDRAVEEWSPEDVETLVIRTLFELQVRTIEIQDDVRIIRALLEDDDEEEEEDPGDDDHT